MKTIGMIGGMSWESTALYYRWINEHTRQALGGLHSAPIALVSVEFEQIAALQREERWDEAGDRLALAARQVEAAGADFLLICANTMHRVAEQVEAAIGIDVLHVADATADAIRADGVDCVGLLGTAYTMEQDFYRGRLENNHGLRVIVPPAEDRKTLHGIIYDELCVGKVNDSSRRSCLDMIEGLSAGGAKGIIAGCTEITMLVKQKHIGLPLYDTTALHVRAAVSRALSSDDT